MTELADAGRSREDADAGPLPDWLDRREYPFRSRWWHTDAGRMHYIDEGSGRPFVFVHGVPAWSFNFRGMVRRLSSRWRCVAMDHLGFGLSDKPTGWHYDPAALAEHLEGLIEGLGLRDITLVVHDWGGPLGLAYALRRPDNVASLVLLNTWMWSSEGDLRARLVARLLASPPYLALEDRTAVTARLFTRLAVARRDRISPGVFTHFEAPFRRRDDRAGLRALVRAIHGSDEWVGSLWQERERLRDLPALVVWGMKDPAFPPRYLAKWEALFTRARIERLAGVGHYPHEEAPGQVLRLLEEFAGA
jgi:haloalkane dehalogenase